MINEIIHISSNTVLSIISYTIKMSGIVYLIQPLEHQHSNIYKIGYSQQENLKRCTGGYQKGTEFVAISQHPNPIECEKILIDHYTEKYTLHHGKEYFSVDVDRKTLVNEFSNIITNYMYYQDATNAANAKHAEPVEQVDHVKKVENVHNTIMNNSKLSKYSCVACKYFTDDMSNHLKHSKTKKHIDAMILYDKTKYRCRGCDEPFNNTTSRWRHEKKCNMLNTHEIVRENTENKNIMKTQSINELSEYKKIIKSQQTQISNYEKMLAGYLDIFNNLNNSNHLK